MAEIAFQPDHLTVCAEVLPVVAAETAGPILVSDIVRVRFPVKLLVGIIVLGIQRLQFSGDCVDLLLVVVVGVVVQIILIERCHRLHRVFWDGVACREQVNRTCTNERDVARDVAIGDRRINQFFRRFDQMGNSIVADNTVHLAQVVLAEVGGVDW